MTLPSSADRRGRMGRVVPPEVPPAEVYRVQAGSVTVRKVRIGGAGQTQVHLFVHGTASSGRIWLKMLGFLSSGSVPIPGVFVLPDLPGMGESPALSRVTFRGWLDFLKGLVAAGFSGSVAETAAGVHLVGHSLGAVVAMHLAREPWVASVALISPVTAEFCREVREASRPGAGASTVVLTRVSGQLVYDRSSLSRDDAALLREDYQRAATTLRSGLPWPEFAVREPELLQGKRVLLLWGEEDRVIAPSYFARMKSELEKGGVLVDPVPLSCCGHLPMLECPAKVAEALARFWRRR